MRKRTVGIIFTVAALVLTGCTSKVQEDTTKKYTTITYMVPGYGSNSYAGKEQIEQIEEEHPEIKFDIRIYSEDQYYASLKTMLATGRGTDLFFVQPEYAGSNGVAALAQAGYLEPVEKLAAIKNAKETKDDSYFLSNGPHIYSVSIRSMGLGVIYNKGLFQKYGVSVPETWQEFLDCCEIFYQANVQPLMMSGKDANTLQYGIYEIAADQIYRKNPDFDEQLRDGEVHFTDKGTWDEVLKRFLNLYDRGYMGDEVMELGYSEASENFRNNGAAMMFAGTGEADSYVQMDEFGFFLLPVEKEDEPELCCMGEVGGISLYSGSDKKELCEELLNDIYTAQIESKAESDKHINDLFPEIRQAKESGNVVTLCNQGWNNNVEHIMEGMLGEYLSGHPLQIEEITTAMEKELRK